MIITILRAINAAVVVLLMIITTIIFSCIISIVFALINIIPACKVKTSLKGLAMPLFSMTWKTFQLISNLFFLCKWEIINKHTINPKSWYLMMSNHQSGVDILAIGAGMSFIAAPLKFFLKKELLWSLPFAGFAAYLAGFPFLNRSAHTKSKKQPRLKDENGKKIRPGVKDIETAKKACRQLLDIPTNLIVFPEGTRFSAQKQLEQKSPYHSLLKPKAMSIATVINEMHEQLSGIIDITIKYKPSKCTMVDFLLGRVKRAEMHYEIIPITPDLLGDFQQDRDYRRKLQSWLNQRWEIKDEKLQNDHE